jgi:hypothetical protein
VLESRLTLHQLLKLELLDLYVVYLHGNGLSNLHHSDFLHFLSEFVSFFFLLLWHKKTLNLIGSSFRRL